MKYRKLFAVLLALSATIAASAQATRTWVSGVGDDVNPCSRTAPCKTFAGAISKTAAGGEISVLDPAGFGAVTIVKSITLNGEGTIGGITNPGVPGITVNAGVNDVVTIKHLFINGVGSGTHGIRYLNGAQLNIEDTNILSQATTGIDVVPTNNPLNLTVRNSSLSGLPASASGVNIGINIESGLPVTVSVQNTSIKNFATGISVSGSGTAIVTGSTITNNVAPSSGGIGLLATNGGVITALNNSLISNDTAIQANANSTINADHNALTGNGTGLVSMPGGTLRISGNILMNNKTGITCGASAPYGTVNSSGDNHKAFNSGGTGSACPASAITPINTL